MRIFLLIITISMLWGGSQALYTVATNPKPTELTIEEFEKSPSDKKWLLIKDGHIDLTQAVTSSSVGSDSAEEAYLPLRQKDAEEGDPVSVIIATKSPQLLEVINGMIRIEDEGQMVEFALKNHEKIFQQKNASGLVRFGIDMDDSDLRQLRELIPELTDDFVVIDEGKQPEWPMVMMLLVGLVTGYAFIKSLGGKKSSQGPPAVPPSPLGGIGRTPPPLAR